MILIANILIGLTKILSSLITLYTIVVVVAALISWVNPDPYNPIVRTLRALTEPVMYRLRRRFSFLYISGIDFTPLAVIFILQFIDIAVLHSVLEYAYALKR
ncbi:YggT family protein [Desulfovibrio sp. OttesenSCG-928-F07]|nr:YggT family protein [Desulfovibrio sp. OttesenSCG-928-F07]